MGWFSWHWGYVWVAEEVGTCGQISALTAVTAFFAKTCSFLLSLLGWRPVPTVAAIGVVDTFPNGQYRGPNSLRRALASLTVTHATAEPFAEGVAPPGRTRGLCGVVGAELARVCSQSATCEQYVVQQPGTCAQLHLWLLHSDACARHQDL